MVDAPRYVKIEMGTRNGWWVTCEHARLVDPQKYAERTVGQISWCVGVRIQDHDTGECFSAGCVEEVPDHQLTGLGHMPPTPDRAGKGETGEIQIAWEDVL